MARGGFISTTVALNKVYKNASTRAAAQRMIADGLIAGEIRARGRRQVASLVEYKLDRKSTKTLHDKSSIVPCYGDIEDIPKKFWQNICDKDYIGWDWCNEVLFNNDSITDEVLYARVVLSEKDINSLIKRVLSLGVSTEEKPKRERKRQPSWDDWVAAVTVLAIERQIDATMTQATLLDRIDAKLQSWGLQSKERSTVAPAARAILSRLRTNPPVTPLDIPLSGCKKP